MAVESKRFFHPEVMRQKVRTLNLLEQAQAGQPKVQIWGKLTFSGHAAMMGIRL